MNASLVQVLKTELDSKNVHTDNIQILKVQYLTKSNRLKIVLKSVNEINDDIKRLIKSIISKKLMGFNNIDLVCYKDVSNISLDEISKQYWIDIVENVSKVMPVSKQSLITSSRSIEGNLLVLRIGDKFMCKLFETKRLGNIIQSVITDMFALKSIVNIKYDPELKDSNYIEVKVKEEKQIIQNALKESKSGNSSVNSEKNDNKENNKSSDKSNYYNKRKHTAKNPNAIFGRDVSGEITNIIDVNETSGVVNICGDIFKVNIIETKSGRKIITFFITDYTSSITVKCFPKPKETEQLLEDIQEGLHCKVRGEAVHDSFAREVVIMGRDIVKTSKLEKMDTFEEKRVELHLHTQMSAMDGMSSAKSLIERAAKWGHPAVAITDHGVVQAYPDAMDAAKKYNIKIIYGVEAYLVNDGVPIVTNVREQTINDTFVVFDLETTGFSSAYDKIIEIGAVKIKNGNIIDSFSTFVNPEIKVPYNITELTSITNDDVKNADTIDSILPKFIEFCGDSVLVAHNANFDMSFIRKNCNDLNIDINYTVMDTVPLAKFLFPELKRYKLNTIAKHLGVSLENHHRAVDDAKATGDILLCCFKLLDDMKITSLDSLNKEFLGNIDVKKLPTYHLIILAKNQVGLKNLYKLISYSNLDYFFRKPRMPKSLIEQYKEGLIIGSACEAGEVYKAVLEGKSQEELKQMIKFYNYLEIQPIMNNEFMLKKGIVKSEEQLKEVNRKIYNLGKENGLPVVATGDVHFLDPKDAKFREILMKGQGFSDAEDQPPLYLKTTNEMLKEFQYLGDDACKEVVIYNPQKIAEEVEVVKPIPDETFPPKIEGAEEDIRNMTLEKAYSIYGNPLPKVVHDRLEKELNSIINNGYAVLYLIAHKLVAKSLKDGYLVGSRGSVGSSLVATMSDITEVNGLPPHYVCPNCKNSEFFTDGSVSSGADLPPKKCPNCGDEYNRNGHDIPFETFLGFNGDKEPDIDLNFSGDNQGDIHRYTEVLFGKGHTFKAGTIGTIADKTAYGFVKKYLDEKNLIVSQAEVERLTQGCTGVKRTSGQHPGGIMVVPSDNEIYNFCPIQHPADDSNSDIITTHFDYHSISGRLLKLDILGHDDPTVLRMLKDTTGLDPITIPIGDEKVLSLFTSPEALGITEEELECPVGCYGIPEFGTKFVRQMLVDTQPKTFSDLVRISGLSHGTDVWLNNAQYFIKEGYTTLKDCIATRDDIMVYLLHKGLPPKEAFTIMEKVRKGKGLTEEHEALMREHKVPDWYIESCKKIKYMFPKGHAVAYVMMAVRIAYYKVYYPQAYYATYFTVRGIDDFDADLIVKGEDVVKRKMDEINALGNNVTQKDKGLLTNLELAFEMYKRNIKFLKVDVYKSHPTKFLIENDDIRPPISSLAGVGTNAAKSIAEAREEGEFISKEDLRKRSKVSKTVVEALSEHGCLKGLPETNQLSLF
ncbi:PolC-type DNA polymerase III [Clostridium botulinum]|uniref:DNA polymerase III PolC-type n=3 Tax=Clostridium botulinum TaxID=1491 RepID=A0A9Q1ZCB0_CLOBO|nr:PolC-type DNA polymerase III [Clostridium botulinum]AEB76127.1 DNA polymerase III, alpha subunit, Gram-positive type [Clostridium botulinum BKT015925]KEH97808.1 DNA polymerase III PolC [Clostridium botulinum D str. 16868]KEI05512.1 DNA polymerase III PolC [Clostridium botulinum C/D str. Sp77]KLU76596.1 DNA polymerase III PolC [Clostridium botulinum V891]KOA75981.1 DNA polymerase III PolC [Clostridium botulinum]